MESPIITNEVRPPVPVRIWDWEAYREDWDLEYPVGIGETEAAAIADLKQQEEDLNN